MTELNKTELTWIDLQQLTQLHRTSTGHTR